MQRGGSVDHTPVGKHVLKGSPRTGKWPAIHLYCTVDPTRKESAEARSLPPYTTVAFLGTSGGTQRISAKGEKLNHYVWDNFTKMLKNVLLKMCVTQLYETRSHISNLSFLNLLDASFHIGWYKLSRSENFLLLYE